MRVSFFVIFLFFSSQSLFGGGPWTAPKGKGFFKLSEWWIVFDQHYTDQGKLDPNITTGVFNTSVYAEYGLTDRFTAIFNGPLFSRSYMNNLISNTTQEILISGESVNTMGDLDLTLKYGITPPGHNMPIAVSLLLGMPTGVTEGGSQHNLQTGDGEFNQLLQLDIGKSLQIAPKVPGYVSLYAGYNNRTNDYSDEIRFGLEAGIGLLNSKLWLTTRLHVLESLKNGATAATSTSTSIFANNSEHASFILEANYYLTRTIGISASAAGAFRGEIISAAPSYSLGVFVDLTK